MRKKFQGKFSFKNWYIYCRRYGHSIAESRLKQQNNSNRPPKYQKPNKYFYQYMKKTRVYHTKTLKLKNSSGKPLRTSYSNSISQTPSYIIFREDHQIDETFTKPI